MYISEDILTRLKIRLESGTPVTIDDSLPLDLAYFLELKRHQGPHEFRD